MGHVAAGGYGFSGEHGKSAPDRLERGQVYWLRLNATEEFEPEFTECHIVCSLELLPISQQRRL